MNTPQDPRIAANSATNPDPITGAPGAHPLGTGVGATLGAVAAGAAVGTVAGPVGTLVGAATGAVVGGLAGKGVAEAIDPTKEDAYWRENFRSRHYVNQGATYDDYGPAYGFGVETASRHPGRSFDDAELELSRQWTSRTGTSTLGWNQAKDAARDAWDRLNQPH
jgi:hypothetical protein